MGSASRKCDVHVIKRESYSPYHEDCFDSLKDEPINLFTIPAVEGDTAIGRHRGYNSGSAEFVSFVDDDDCIIPGIYEKCIKALEKNPWAFGVHTREWIWENGGMHLSDIPDPNWHWSRYFFTVHHVVVYRRDLVIPYVERVKGCKVGSEHYMNLLIMSEGYRFVYLDDIGYIWRVHPGSIRSYGMTQPYQTDANNLLRKGIAEVRNAG